MSVFSKERLMITVLARIKADIEKIHPEDKYALNLVNDLLHHFCWRLYDQENFATDEKLS